MTPSVVVIDDKALAAAMEPAHRERDDDLVERMERMRDRLPQWSPLIGSGMTGGDVR